MLKHRVVEKLNVYSYSIKQSTLFIVNKIRVRSIYQTEDELLDC
jgi:hypothetical protein